MSAFGLQFFYSLSNRDIFPEGRGEDALGFIDSFVNRLFLYIGGKVHNVCYGINNHLLFFLPC